MIKKLLSKQKLTHNTLLFHLLLMLNYTLVVIIQVDLEMIKLILSKLLETVSELLIYVMISDNLLKQDISILIVILMLKIVLQIV